jgi:DNA-binding transcriptional MerR regulator
MDDSTGPFTIGQLARRTGLDARTLRFWSDAGVVPPVTRSPGGYRLYDAGSAARLELVRTLRELGLGLDDVRRVLDGRATVVEVAEAHVSAIDAQIRSLKVSRAVLSTVSKRGSTTEEAALMNRLARLSAAERARIVEDFKAEVYAGLTVDESLRDRVRDLRIDLPDDPTPEQVDAWIELAELVQDPGFRARLRAFFELTTPLPDGGRPPGSSRRSRSSARAASTPRPRRRRGWPPACSATRTSRPYGPACRPGWRRTPTGTASSWRGSGETAPHRRRPGSWNGWRPRSRPPADEPPIRQVTSQIEASVCSVGTWHTVLPYSSQP